MAEDNSDKGFLKGRFKTRIAYRATAARILGEYLMAEIVRKITNP